ncbi:BTAD domain-containing putative transcriptional regulator [Streptomyces sp. NPDC096142]|uniref:helix-turn-helix transcriptional regulator n=1 Tax=Streptomyces sp. NPDC096142 TaxID=3366077 RepID=UPI0037F294D2
MTVAEAAEVLWGDDPPPSAPAVLRRYAGALRRVLEPAVPRAGAASPLLREAGGYRFPADARSSDLLRFRATRDRARDAGRTGEPERAVALYAEALALWQAPAAANIPSRVRAHRVFADLDEERLAAATEAADVALGCGSVETVLPELRRLARHHPLDEPLHSRLILALSLAGDRAEALQTYQRVCAQLRDQLGADPSPALLAAQRQALAGGGPAAEAVDPAAPDGRADALAPVVRPAQLPPRYEYFTGRETEIGRLLGDLTAGAVVINAIGGMAGVGKTTLAVHLAHRVAPRFPDGQLYVNLRGFDLRGSAMDPAEAVRGFLEALGVGPQQIPDRIDAQVALYRRLLAGRRVLVLLDNARDAEQVRPLLPAAAGCLVLITSRDQLTSLVVADGARPLTLDLLSRADATESLARRLGADRVAAEPEAVEEIITLCGRLPLALALTSARALVNPGFPLAAIAAELREAHGSLDAFSNPDATTDVRSVFGWSYRALSTDTGRLFRMLSAHPGPDIGVRAAAALAGRPVRQTRASLDELTHAHLLTERSPGRYVFHDLLRAYASELSLTEESEGELDGAVRRMLDHYLRTAHDALDRLEPTGLFPRPGPAPDAMATPALADTDAALTWFTAEHAALIGVVSLAADLGHGTLAWRLARSLDPFHERQGHWHDWAALQRTALSAAQRQSDPAGLGHAHAGLGRAHSLLRRYGSAEDHLGRAQAQFEELGDAMGQAYVQRSLGWIMTRTGRHEAAIHHTAQALDLYRAADHLKGQAETLNAIGWYLAVLGDLRGAAEHAVESLTLYRRMSGADPQGQGLTWDTLAYVHHRLGRLRRARTCYERAIRLFHRSGDRYNEAGSLDRIGDVHEAAGDHGAAREARERALHILTVIDPPWAAEIRAKLPGRERKGDRRPTRPARATVASSGRPARAPGGGRKTDDYRSVLPALAERLSDETHRLVNDSGTASRALYERFLDARRRARSPIAAVDSAAMFVNSAAAAILRSSDRIPLWEWARQEAAAPAGRTSPPFVLASGARAERCEGIREGGMLIGAVVWLKAPEPAAPGGREWDTLTRSERSVAEHVARGLTNRETAALLFVSPHTVDYYLRQVFRKLQIRSRVELAGLMAASEQDPSTTRSRGVPGRETS